MIYAKLFISMFKIGILSFGGGYVAIPLIQKEIVELNGWLTMTEFTDIITIAEMTPGPIAINSATFVGIKIGGILGAVIATTGCILPSCAIVIFLAKLYYKYRHLEIMKHILSGLHPAVAGMIASSGFSILLLALFNGSFITDINIISAIIFVLSIFLMRKFRFSPIYVILGAGVIGIAVYALLPV